MQTLAQHHNFGVTMVAVYLAVRGVMVMITVEMAVMKMVAVRKCVFTCKINVVWHFYCIII